jgi:hypothetical protein
LKATSLPGEANGYGDGPVMEIGDADDFSCAFSATTGFKVRASSVRTNQTPPLAPHRATVVRCCSFIPCLYGWPSQTFLSLQPSLHGTALDGYLQMQYSPAAAKPTMPARQVSASLYLFLASDCMFLVQTSTDP